MVNGYFVFVLATVVGFFLLDFVSRLMNLGALKPELPGEFSDVFDAGEYSKSQDYTREGTRFGLFEDTASLIIFLAFWWLGGFGWLDELVRSVVTENSILQGLMFMALLYLGSTVLSVPFELYDTFVIEEKFGFNKTTMGTFVADKLKGLLLALPIGCANSRPGVIPVRPIRSECMALWLDFRVRFFAADGVLGSDIHHAAIQQVQAVGGW